MQTRAPDSEPSPREVWLRGLFMLLFVIGFTVGQWLLNLLAVMQFLWLLFAREPNRFIAAFGNSLAHWLAETARYLTCATEDRPFPWKPWPPAALDTTPPFPPTSSS